MSGHDMDKDTAAPEPDEAGLREQLSALVDGRLDPVRTRFLLRRLQHDAELAGCFERWQLAGDALRGAGPVALPAGFGPSVTRAIAAEAASTPASASRGWRRPWALGALAASVAAVALFVARPLVDGEPPGAGASAVVSLPEFEVPFAPAGQATADEAQGERIVQAGAAAAAAQGASVASPNAPPDDTAVAVAEATTTPLPTEAADPFRSPVPPQSRPWPRAVLPGLSGAATDVFNVDHGGRVAAPPAVGPFSPPAVAGGQANTDGDEPLPPGE